MLSLLLRNLLFTILKPGVVVGLLPYLILRGYHRLNFKLSHIIHYLGIVVFTIGLTITISCIVRFAFEGRGTLSPLDPTKKLVTKGLYNYSRNPMYLGVITMLAGETIFFRSWVLLFYLFGVFILFNLFIKLIEEPRLKKDFGVQYTDYCKAVKMWV